MVFGKRLCYNSFSIRYRTLSKERSAVYMAHELLSVKLCELDEKFERLHSRIQLSQTSDKSSLQKETQLVRRECEEEELILR